MTGSIEEFNAIFDGLDPEQKDFLAMGILLGSVEVAKVILAAFNSLPDPKGFLVDHANGLIADVVELKSRMEEK